MDCRASLAMTNGALAITPTVSTAFFAALAWVFLVVGGAAAFQTAQLSLAGGKANALGWHGTGACLAVSFGTELFGHENNSNK
jgi:hypothetical protein